MLSGVKSHETSVYKLNRVARFFERRRGRSHAKNYIREKTLDENVYVDLVARAEDWGFNTSKLIRVEQN